MKTLYINDTVYTETEVASMNLPDLDSLMCAVQVEIHRIATEKKRLATLPYDKKNKSTLNKVIKSSKELMELQDAVNFISIMRKRKRNTQVSQLAWYKKFHEICGKKLRKGQLARIEKEASDGIIGNCE